MPPPPPLCVTGTLNRHLLGSVHLSPRGHLSMYRCAHNGQHPYLLSIRPDGHEMTLTLVLPDRLTIASQGQALFDEFSVRFTGASNGRFC
jgi:hypothetical protein